MPFVKFIILKSEQRICGTDLPACRLIGEAEYERIFCHAVDIIRRMCYNRSEIIENKG